MKRAKLAFAASMLVVSAVFLIAEPPVMASAPKKARSRVVEVARSFCGCPYRLGGLDRSGIDCSGLVYRAYQDGMGAEVPRSSRELYSFSERLTRDKLQPGDLVFFAATKTISHVGIYEGEGIFIHAASDGPRTGVIESSLSENSWARTYVGCGRLLPPSEYLGLIFDASLGPSVGTALPLLRDLGSLGLDYENLDIPAGVEVVCDRAEDKRRMKEPSVFRFTS
jgi:Cell wall-associated hydrolases (invasion-associated proteins)